MLRIITGDSSCVCGYDPQTEQRFSEWKRLQSPGLKKTHQVSATKSMLGVFFEINEAVHIEFVPHSQTVNAILPRCSEASEEEHSVQTI